MTPWKLIAPAVAGLSLLLVAYAGCVATPLPTPPSARIDRMALVESGDAEVTLSGEDGAIDRGDALVTSVRITGEQAWTRVALGAGGDFSATLPGAVSDTYMIEAISQDRDVFLVAIAGIAGGGGVTEADPGPDADGDGSPDAVDCAPAVPDVGGRRCDEACGPEICNGLDDDCDGAVDDDCATACASVDECDDGDPATTDACEDGVCVAYPAGCVPETCNGADDDCDGLVDEGCGDDLDGDGFVAPEDCDDTDASINPGAREICDGLDDDCDGVVDEECAGGCATAEDCGGGTCLDGVCVCPAGQALCELRCVDVTGDPANCGGCGIVCAAGESCTGGICTS